MISLTSICTILLAFLACANAYYVTLDAHAEECFFDKVTAGTKLGKQDFPSSFPLVCSLKNAFSLL